MYQLLKMSVFAFFCNRWSLILGCFFPVSILKNIPSLKANFDHVFEVFQGLFFGFLLEWKDALGTKLWFLYEGNTGIYQNRLK